ncbi:hemerythrin domain-containing protein [Hyalangium minutum]|uniref:Regulator of cell morphogenesis and NO signaling n=1 Tax=Hyalangium minutum TaxID=394096 RepID=A0A085WJF0_9BACT|nr:hemerythrin domain-containing protein [Hyalangium minutum]KFE67813.1 Regulator of cell morphogenesis and NO signaling [Hyalangium minutum]
MDALDLLKEQHDEVNTLFKKFEKLEEGSTAELRELFVMIADRLSAHATIEEQFFYPSIKTDKTEDLIREAVEEHLGVKRIIADLLEMEPSDEQFAAKMKVLMENVEHHVEEEEDEMFKLVRKVLDKDQRFALGVQMKAEFDELMKGEPRNEVPMQTDEAAPV